ncbi:MAG TPA: thiamine phosphate synthase [Gemmatimonadaceae bacterium]
MSPSDSLRLIAITDNLRDGVDGLLGRARAARRGGATMIQLRLPDEGAHTVAAVARALIDALDVPVVVHGRLDAALAAGAAGVHLGVRDIAVTDARRIAGGEFIVGRSAANDEDLAHAAGADYVAVGPVFPADDRRPGITLGISEFERLARSASVPAVAIGGISAATAGDAVRAGACGVALISGIFGSSDPERSARELRSAIGM